MNIKKLRVWDVQNKWFLKRPVDFEQTEDRGIQFFPLYAEKNNLVICSSFTGIADKNGVEVYEGDIIDCLERKGGEIKWSEKYLGWIVDFNGYVAPLYAISEIKEFEVIGNTYSK